MSLASFTDEALVRYYVNMRSMVTLGIGINQFTLLGEQARKRARALEDELTRRGIEFDPIVWPD